MTASCAWPLRGAATLLTLLWTAPALAAPAQPATAPAATEPAQPDAGPAAAEPAEPAEPEPAAEAPEAVAAVEPEPEPAPAPEPALPPLRTEPPPEAPPAVGNGSPQPEPAPRHRLMYSNALVVRINPLGLEDRFSLMYRRRLSARTGKLWDDTYFGLGITPSVSPSVTRVGPTMQLVPLAILQFRASYYFIAYYGSHKYKVHDFDSPKDEFGPDTLKGRADAKQATNAIGGQAELSALFQVKFGPIALRDEVIFYNNNIKLPGTSDVFFDFRHDIMAPGKGWFLSNDTDLIYVNTKIRLNAGVRATYYHVFYPKGVYEPGDRIDDSNTTARVGPLISYAFKDRPEKRFTKPTLFFMAQWWVKHRYRTGQEVSQALPLMVLGFSFMGELWRKS